MSNIKEKNVVVTGVMGDIGSATVNRFLFEGAFVIGLDLQDEDQIAKKYGYNPNFIPRQCDVTDRERIKHIVAEIIDAKGKIDILVNCAGITNDAMSHKMEFSQWTSVLDINLTGTFNVIQAIIPHMREKKYGKIINLASTSAHGNIGQVNYSASKSGLIGLTKTLAKELGRYNINVNCISPGYIISEMTANLPEKVITSLISSTPLGRGATPDEPANVIFFLASDEASYITGAEIPVTGGMMMNI